MPAHSGGLNVPPPPCRAIRGLTPPPSAPGVCFLYLGLEDVTRVARKGGVAVAHARVEVTHAAPATGEVLLDVGRDRVHDHARGCVPRGDLKAAKEREA